MPIRCFWTLSENINRISAQEDMRALSVANHSQGGESALKYREHLEIEMGEVFTYKYSSKEITEQNKLDRAGLDKLRASIRRT